MLPRVIKLAYSYRSIQEANMTSMPVPGKIRVVLTLSSLLLLAACGGGGASDSGVNPVSSLPPAPPVAPPQPEAPPEVVLAATYTDLVSGTSSSQPGWPAWVGPVDRAALGGVGCTGTGIVHQHSLVSIYKNGVRMGPPDNVGHAACSYELHTHDLTGMVHIHSDVEKTFTLGQFFTLWGQPLAAGNTAGLSGPVRFYLIQNEQLTPYAGDPAQLALVPHREIVIISGASPGVLPKYRWPSSL
jgi:hypothetical protein